MTLSSFYVELVMNPGPSHGTTSPALVYCYFETGSCCVAKCPGCSCTCDLPALAFQSAGVKSVRHHAQTVLLFLNDYESQAWWPMPVIPAHGKLRQQDCQEVQANLDYTVKPCLKKPESKGLEI